MILVKDKDSRPCGRSALLVMDAIKVPLEINIGNLETDRQNFKKG
jgi:hypothetical protein